jgi:hypothetical protein
MESAARSGRRNLRRHFGRRHFPGGNDPSSPKFRADMTAEEVAIPRSTATFAEQPVGASAPALP